MASEESAEATDDVAAGDVAEEDEAAGAAETPGADADVPQVDTLHLTVSLLSGNTLPLSLQSGETVEALTRAAAALFSLDEKSVKLVHNDKELGAGPAGQQQTLREAGLCDGDMLQAVVRSPVRPMMPSNRFRLKLKHKSIGRSSSSVAEFRVKGDLSHSTVQLEVWRRSDHDEMTINTQEGTIQMTMQHWMTGEKVVTKPLGFSKPLRDLLESHLEKATLVTDDADRFWLLPGQDASSAPRAPPGGRQRDEDWTTALPHRNSSDPISWLAPSADGAEFIVNVEIAKAIALLRVLVDGSGRPIRAAVAEDDAEEYWVDGH